MIQFKIAILLAFICGSYGSIHMLNLNPELGIAKIKLSSNGFVQTSVFTLTHVVKLDIINHMVKGLEKSIQNKSEEFKKLPVENEILVNKVKVLRTTMNHLLNKNTFRNKRGLEWLGTGIKWMTGKVFSFSCFFLLIFYEFIFLRT